VVDSALSVEEELRRFRAAIGGQPVRRLAHASASIEALVARFARALVQNDTGEFRRMGVSAREYADLVYPESPHTHPPYRQSVSFSWFQVQSASVVGLSRMLERRGGRPLHVSGHVCTRRPEQQGSNRLWTRCLVRVRQTDGSETEERLFGALLERDGQFKFLSFANAY
jgi:hypothetical protein